MLLRARIAVLGAGLVLTSCSSMRVSEFSGTRPVFDPAEFFSGRTSSSGVMENRSGAPSTVVKTQTVGRREGDTLRLEQELEIGANERQHRSWRIRKLDAQHFEATANDMVGTARGQAYGNAFHWSFTLALSPGNPLANVRMSQWMYLQPDGRTMLNRTTITKLGFVVAQVTEQFNKLRD